MLTTLAQLTQYLFKHQWKCFNLQFFIFAQHLGYNALYKFPSSFPFLVLSSGILIRFFIIILTYTEEGKGRMRRNAFYNCDIKDAQMGF